MLISRSSKYIHIFMKNEMSTRNGKIINHLITLNELSCILRIYSLFTGYWIRDSFKHENRNRKKKKNETRVEQKEEKPHNAQQFDSRNSQLRSRN